MTRLDWPSILPTARQALEDCGSVAGAAARLSAQLGRLVTPGALDAALRRDRWREQTERDARQGGRTTGPACVAAVPALVPPAPEPNHTPVICPVPSTRQTDDGADRRGGALDDAAILREQNRELLAEVTRLRKSALTEERVRRELLRLADAPHAPPDWLVDRSLAPDGSYGTPTLFASDQHLGEVVDPAQIGGVNRYDMTIARARWRRCIEKTISLCFSFLAQPHFDGVVFALGGDGLSGDIHEELSATNERECLPLVLEYADLIAWSVRELRRAFGRVFVPAVIGNHPRLTKKPRAKGAAYTNLDWLAYQIASREFGGDSAVRFLIADGEDARYSVHGHRYCLTHGAQFRGGDGIIGPLGPVFRGDAKKRARNAQVDQSYDTLLLAHFHQLRMDSRIIMNGSLKGYDEYAFHGNFPYEPPKQALWITHPQMGITFSMPVLPEDPAPVEQAEWAAA